jgi:hypothetical protein
MKSQERHGKRDYPEYLVWTEMKQRCFNANHRNFKHYGGRGITVCSEWRNSFESFLRDMGRRPDGLTLDRIDPNKGYTPSNCRWTTWCIQRRNKRSNVWIEFDGKRLTLEDWSNLTGISTGTLRQRILDYRWPLQRALTEPPGTQRSSNRWITYRGETKTAVEWSRHFGVSYQTLRTRLNKLQWPVEKALETPVYHRQPTPQPFNSS